jgi:hypothetical protein
MIGLLCQTVLYLEGSGNPLTKGFQLCGLK